MLFVSILLLSCSNNQEIPPSTTLSNIMLGTWRLIEGTVITGSDTVITDYTKDRSMLKIINETHFAFLMHDTHEGKDSTTAMFVAGGGKYTYKDSVYIESLEYCNAREWEGEDFTFKISFRNDTLTQHGREKAEEAGVDRLIIEKYVRAK